MMRSVARKFFCLLSAILFFCTVVPASALTINDLPAPAALNANVDAPAFVMDGIGDECYASSDVRGKTTLFVFGRITCYNTNSFLTGIKDAIPLLKQNGVSVLVGLVDDPSDEELKAFSAKYNQVDCGKLVDDAYNPMWNGLTAVSYNTSNGVIFPVVFLKDSNDNLRYYSTNYVEAPLKVVSAALGLVGVVAQAEDKSPTLSLTVNKTVAGLNEKISFSYEAKNTDDLNMPYVQWRIYEWKNGESELVNYAMPWFSSEGPLLGTEGDESHEVDDPEVEKVTIEVRLIAYNREVMSKSEDVVIDKSRIYDPIGDFVRRCYRIILNREAETEGLNYWKERLSSGEATAAQIIKGFVDSYEFRGKNLSYGDQVEVLYQVMLDRGSDEAGKAYWVSMLNGGNTLAAVINGFCNSIEFKGICDEYGITPGSVNAGEAKPPQQEAPAPAVDRDKIRAYVTRCYRIILSREPDQEGLNYWTEKMASGELQAAAIIDQFVNSIEFKGKQLSNREAVEVLYQAMLGRGSDADGMSYWLSKLETGAPFAVIINGFCNSIEFKGICAEYGITPGSVAVASVRTHAEPEEQEIPEDEATEPEEAAEAALADERTEQARAFVTHCYQSALLRDPGAEEVDYYANQILSGQMTAKDVARAFVFSQEFQGKWTDNTAFVRVLYRLCLDREADADGLVYWTDKLANGETAAAVFNALTENKEFVQVCATYSVPAGVDTNAIRAQEEAAAAAEAEANEAPAAPASEFTNEEKIRTFVSRFYRDAMGREADEEGLNYYTSRILNGEATPKDVAGEIILSEEFRGRMPGNEDLVRILYRVYLGREADEEGLANWAGQLDSGATLETILNGFAGSEEFAAVVNGLR